MWGSFVVRVCSEILLVGTIDTSATKGKYGVASEDVGVSGTLFVMSCDEL